MPPKPKKKTPKQLLAEAELLVLALRQELQSTKKDYGEILSRMATANSELKGVVLKQELQLASSFDARELKLRLDLSQARLEVRDLKEIEKAGREARAAIETHEAERLHLQRQLAEAVGAREVMERAHATELLVYKQSVTKVTVGLEQKFKVSHLHSACEGVGFKICGDPFLGTSRFHTRTHTHNTHLHTTNTNTYTYTHLHLACCRSKWG